MFDHITPAFLIAAACLFGVMAAGPRLNQMKEDHKQGVEKITPELNEIQAKWKARKKEDSNWRKAMAREMLDMYKVNGLWVHFPYVLLLIYLAMWAFLMVSTADMVARGLGWR